MKAINKLICFLAAITIILSSCQKEPVANISADKTEVEVNESVMFTNTTTDGVTYNWDYGDGTNSTDKEPVNSWSTAGTYNVKMTASSKNGKKTDEATISIKVNDLNAKYLGTYTVSEIWSSQTCGGGQQNYTMTITAGSSGTTVIISNFTHLFSNITGDVSDTKIIIPTQNGVTDGTGKTWDINSGSFIPNSPDVLTLDFSLNDISYANTCGSYGGTAEATK